MLKSIGLGLVMMLVCGGASARSHGARSCVCTQYAPRVVPTPNFALVLTYTNRVYRFRFKLPEEWRGFTIVGNAWEGTVYDANGNIIEDRVESGPEISIRHPHYSGNAPYKDISIMVFTHAQWKLAESGAMSVSAAPVGPYEIGRNKKYVFALPPRWSTGDELGADEVIDIVSQHPFAAY